MTVGVAVVAIGLGGLLALAFMAGVFVRPSVSLSRVERQVASLRSEVDGYRAAHTNQMESLDRRLSGLEDTAAKAANEWRMASEQLMGLLGPDAATGGEVPVL